MTIKSKVILVKMKKPYHNLFYKKIDITNNINKLVFFYTMHENCTNHNKLDVIWCDVCVHKKKHIKDIV